MSHYPAPTDICTIITTFRPDDNFYKRVERIKKQVPLVIIVNDGDSIDNIINLKKWFDWEKNILLHHNTINVGIAASLNKGVNIAKNNGYKWILTLDDDSLVKSDFVERLINGLKSIKIDKPIGLIGMSWIEPNNNEKCKPIRESVTYFEKRGIITSGSLFSVDTYDKVGAFREDFYIDLVDYDYCLRARQKGFAIIKLNEIGFEHSIGRKEFIYVMGHKVVLGSHKAFRTYYAFRNSTVLALEYIKNDPLYSISVLLAQTKSLFKILLFGQDKKKIIIHVIWGIHDGLTRKLGKRIPAQ
jgi:rhamnosyltransferase